MLAEAAEGASMADVFHEGELQIQELAGERAPASRNGRIIASAIAAGMFPFIAKQPFCVLGSRDDQGRVWASVLLGEAGFMTAAATSVAFDLTRAHRQPDDGLWRHLATRPEVGMLVIDLATRRRVRINGRL